MVKNDEKCGRKLNLLSAFVVLFLFQILFFCFFSFVFSFLLFSFFSSFLKTFKHLFFIFYYCSEYPESQAPNTSAANISSPVRWDTLRTWSTTLAPAAVTLNCTFDTDGTCGWATPPEYPANVSRGSGEFEDWCDRRSEKSGVMDWPLQWEQGVCV